MLSVVFRQHDRQHAPSYFWISGIWGMSFELPVVVVDFEQDLVAGDLDKTKIMLAIRIIVGVEIVVVSYLLKDVRLEVVAQGRDCLCINDVPAQESCANEPPSLKWSDLRYVIWHQGGPICRGSDTSRKRLSRSCDS